MPQGGSGGKGNGGAGVTTNGGSKKKMSSKVQSSSYRMAADAAEAAPGVRQVRAAPEKGAGGPGATQDVGASRAAGAAHTVISPLITRRNKAVAAQRNGERVEAEHAARVSARAAAVRSKPVDGTGKRGVVLGGGGEGRPERQVRLQYIAKQQAESRVAQREKQLRAKAQRDAPYVKKQEIAERRYANAQERERQSAVRAVGELPMVRQRREERLSGGQASGRTAAATGPWDGSVAAAGEQVVLLLDMLAERLQGGIGGGGAVDMMRSYKLLCTVLQNASTKGEAEPKYRRLKARNDKVWAALLQHPEVVAVLESAGFTPGAATPPERRIDPTVGGDDLAGEMERLHQQLAEQLDGGETIWPFPHSCTALVCNMVN